LLKTAEERKGASGEEVKSNITDNQSAKIQGAHGYIPGYHGIAIGDSNSQVIVAAEAFGSGSASEHFSLMLERLNERMSALSGGLKRSYRTSSSAQGTNHLRDGPLHGGKQRFTAAAVEYDEEGNKYRCPEKKELLYKGQVKLKWNSGEQ
jgi:hypothetical protein